VKSSRWVQNMANAVWVLTRNIGFPFQSCSMRSRSQDPFTYPIQLYMLIWNRVIWLWLLNECIYFAAKMLAIRYAYGNIKCILTHYHMRFIKLLQHKLKTTSYAKICAWLVVVNCIPSINVSWS